MSKIHNGTFVQSIREGEIVFLMQWCSNTKGNYVLVQEIQRGGRRGSIIIPEGQNGNGWRGFGFELCRILVQ